MSDKFTLSQVSDETKAQLAAACTALAIEGGECDYKELSAIVRSVVKTAQKEVQKDVAANDGREALYNLASFEIWDVSAGEDNADEEAKAPPVEGISGIEAIMLTIQGYAGQFHGTDNPPPVELTYDALMAREKSLRSTLSRARGKAPFRVRYTIGEFKYLICAVVEKHVEEAPLSTQDTEDPFK